MTWFAWRQLRTPIWITGLVAAALAAVLAIMAPTLSTQWSDSGAAACTSGCQDAINTFLTLVVHSANEVVYQVALVAMYVLPALVGLFWGAPLIARELEAGTHRLAWNQTVSRSRWLATKLAVGGGAAAVTVGLASWTVTAWSTHIDAAKYFRITPLTFGARGIVPIGYTLFAFALGVTMGMLIRRTVPAMATTLAVYVGAVAAMPLWLRAHLMPAQHLLSPLDLSQLEELSMRPGGQMQVISSAIPDGAWALVNNTITPSGDVFVGPADPQFCGENTGPRACLDWVGTLGLRQDLTYHPASHFWPLQWIETGVFVALAAALVAFCFWWTRRRLA